MHRLPVRATCLLLFGWALALSSGAQERLKSMPGYERYERISREGRDAVKLGAFTVVWTNEGRAFDYRWDGKRFRYDVLTSTATELSSSTNRTAPTTAPARRILKPERGRQYTAALSPDGRHSAEYRDRNVWLGDASGSNLVAITTEGNAQKRVKLGSAPWVYGEELYQDTAMWWSSNSAKLAFYRFDESPVPDYHLALGQTKLQTTLSTEPYPKTGSTNPLVDIFIYDLAAKKTVRVDVRDGQPFSDDAVGHYVYGVSWTRDSRELIFHRTNRRQNVMELCAANAGTGKSRVIVREEWLPSWTENSPKFRFLADGRRFIWSSERTGWRNFYLYEISGKLLGALTAHDFEVAEIAHVDEERGWFYYTAHSGENPMKVQLHRVRFDGSGHERLTDPAFHHTISFSPNGRHFIDIAQTHDTPPVTRLRDANGAFVAEVARSDTKKFQDLGLRPVELLTFKAADGVTDLYGLLHKPSNFKPWKRYPLLVSVYAGPHTTGARETFVMPSALTELGFLVASFDSRSASGRGKRFLDSIYLRFGQPEIDDQAAGVRALRERWHVDGRRVGIFGTSYGGTAAALALMRFPDVFHTACASSGVMDFRNYDTIYTERYMWTPQGNKDGYDAANVMNHVTNMTGRLMIFYGTADDNVHPANSLQLIQALQRAGKSFEVQVGPDQGHTAINRDRMMEFFFENLRN